MTVGKEHLPAAEGRALGDASLRSAAETAQVERDRPLLHQRGGVLEVGEEARLVRGRIPLDLLVEHIELPGRQHDHAEVRDRRRIGDVPLVDGHLPDEIGLPERQRREIRSARRRPRLQPRELHGLRVQASLARKPEAGVELLRELRRERLRDGRSACRDDDVEDVASVGDLLVDPRDGSDVRRAVAREVGEVAGARGRSRHAHGNAGDREVGVVERAELRVLVLPEDERPPRVPRGLVPVDAGVDVGDARGAGERVAVLEHVSAEAAELLHRRLAGAGRVCRGLGVRDRPRVTRDRERTCRRADRRFRQRHDRKLHAVRRARGSRRDENHAGERRTEQDVLHRAQVTPRRYSSCRRRR